MHTMALALTFTGPRSYGTVLPPSFCHSKEQSDEESLPYEKIIGLSFRAPQLREESAPLLVREYESADCFDKPARRAEFLLTQVR
jgi:hypothetical protein